MMRVLTPNGNVIEVEKAEAIVEKESALTEGISDCVRQQKTKASLPADCIFR